MLRAALTALALLPVTFAFVLGLSLATGCNAFGHRNPEAACVYWGMNLGGLQMLGALFFFMGFIVSVPWLVAGVVLAFIPATREQWWRNVIVHGVVSTVLFFLAWPAVLASVALFGLISWWRIPRDAVAPDQPA